MEDELDRLLRRPLLSPPPDFTGEVMRRAQRLRPVAKEPPWRFAVQWLALAAAGAPAALQALSFIFNIWTAVSAG